MFLVLAAILLVTVLFLLTDRRYRWFYILYETLGRDIRAGWRFVKLSIKLYLYERNNQTVPKVFTTLAKQHPERIAFYFEDETWTYKRVEELSNRVAHFFKAEGYKRGDTVALLLESSPEYVCIWLGLSKIGVVTALVNNNLVSDPLMHSLKCSNASGFIFGANFSQVVKNVAGGLNGTKLYEWRDRSQKPQLENLGLDVKDRLEDQDSSSPHEEMEGGRTKDKILFIYTSGTTGLPKAAVITNTRFFFMAYALYTMMDIRQDDILYTPLPLYHSSGGLVGVGQSILCGIPVVIRKKFSASNFWKDCIKYRCTIAQYIGEICRYILAVHANDKEPPKHNVRLIVGNGLRPQIWNQFVTQFNVPQVGEFYGATEGNSNLINVDNKMGAVGFVPRYARQLYPVTLVKCNEATGEPIRNERGFCIPCQPGEPGVMIGNISSKRAANNFTGYADEKSTQSKVLKNVFSIGDLYFNSGDILVQDELGYYYFRDRTGDTFRWKGENVATSEVEAVISNLVDYRDAVVYGVQIPGTEGRAGMVAIVDTNNTLDLNTFCKGVKENLPSYSVPVFVRILQNGTALTGTYKLKKVELQKEGFNIDQIKDKVYFYDAKSSKYVELTEDIYNKIMSGEMRL